MPCSACTPASSVSTRYRLHASDGGEADIYVTLEPLFDSMMINHFSPSQVLDLVVAFARAAGSCHRWIRMLRHGVVCR